MDDVFRALADPHRRQLLDRLNARNGQTLRELCAHLEMTRQAVSKHLTVLEAALLVTTVRRGREKLHYLNPAPINEIADRWIHRYDRGRVEALADLKRALEDSPMDTIDTSPDRPDFVYTTYIRTTPERLFAALTEPAFTSRYWNTAFDTDWQPGSEMTWVLPGDIRNCDAEQVVLEYDPPRRLSYRWHAFTAEWAAAYDRDEELRARLATEPKSKVTFELEPDGPLTKLTVIHDDFTPDSVVARMVRDGWPRVIGALKTLLEAGGADDDGFATSVIAHAPATAVFAALTTLDGLGGWWMPDVAGAPALVGGEVTFRFDDHHVTMRVDHLEPTLVVWTCVESTKFVEWIGDTLWFDLHERDEASTRIDFRQVGLVPSCDCYGICADGWDHYVHSLAELAATGSGEPYGSEGHRAARHATVGSA